MEDDAERLQEPERMEYIRRTQISGLTKQGAYDLIEIGAISKGRTWICTMFSVHIIAFSFVFL